MPKKTKRKTDFGPREFSFVRGANLTEAFPHIRKGECGIITAQRPEFSPSENAERSSVLLDNLLCAFFRAKEACVFELRLNAKNDQSIEHYGVKFFFICERPIYKQKSTYSPLFPQLVDLARLFQQQSFIHIPYRKIEEVAEAELAKAQFHLPQAEFLSKKLGIVRFKKNPDQIEILKDDTSVTFDVASNAHVVTGSFMAALRYHHMSRRHFAGQPKPPSKPKQTTIRQPPKPFRWSGDCVIKNMRYGSGNAPVASPDGSRQ